MVLKIAARMTVVLGLCAAMAATLMALRGDGLQEASSPRSAHPGGEPATRELARCRAIGVAAASDPACHRAWAENRRRFLGTDAPPMPMPERFGPSTNRPVSP
ncbi:putative entry exclusion protein TrbK-alt [Mesorhizobium sp. CO1-1-2]|uniref:putative entry exclusion protein TrbK-alt n=1 Tax=Mesorhizobium sp. CO1-1-2 TaxID=2876635 RepID=UPI001CCD0F9D|nr:putative entry exclusion protein TrbK-alt [Mesorhizobium sp. CO1-1-2]MBZ9683921.1 putative entry exclusion protein TrbK-alt [Mesorhizobium sp. CO1-1-2]